ncbi:hypothetical protein EJB05_04062, partial [Eragrostis curvula]
MLLCISFISTIFVRISGADLDRAQRRRSSALGVQSSTNRCGRPRTHMMLPCRWSRHGRAKLLHTDTGFCARLQPAHNRQRPHRLSKQVRCRQPDKFTVDGAP